VRRFNEVMAETDNPEVLPSPRTARFGEGEEGRGARASAGWRLLGPDLWDVCLSSFVMCARSSSAFRGRRQKKSEYDIITLIAVCSSRLICLQSIKPLARFITGLTWLANKLLGVV